MDTLNTPILSCLCGETSYDIPFQKNSLLNGDRGESLIKCHKCHLIRTTPRPLVQTSNEEELYQNEDYFAGARTNLELWYRMQDPILKDVKKFKKTGKWLDIGSGLGFLPKTARNAGFNAIGIDLNHAVVKEGQALEHPVSVTNLNELKDDSFDIISLNHVLEHTESPRDFLKFIATKLKPDGVLIVGVPNIQGAIPKFIRFINSMGMKRGNNWLWHGYQLKQHLWHFTPETIETVIPQELELSYKNRSDNMYYGFLEIKKLRYQFLKYLFMIFAHLRMGDNLRLVLSKKAS